MRIVEGMFNRFLLYGCAGWILEVLFTGTSSALVHQDKGATSKTYLWMHPIYGAAGLLLEWMSRVMKPKLPLPVRALAAVPIIFGIEYVSGWVLCRALGKCPWDYSRARYHLDGFIRLDYAPAWYAAALGFEYARTELYEWKTSWRGRKTIVGRALRFALLP